MITIAHNMMAMNAMRQYNIVNSKQAKSTEKLSSGYKINRAADDAAGLAISEKMRRQIRGLNQATFNVQEAVGYVQTADGALNEAHEMLQRMNELAVKASNGTLSDIDREYTDAEVQHLKGELDRIFGTTTFNEELIWNPETDKKKQIATEYARSVSPVGGSNSFAITNDNCGVMPNPNHIKMLADKEKGIAATWTGYDGKTYTTNYKKVDWENLPGTNYTFSLSELYPEFDATDSSKDGNKFYDATGKPLINNKLGFSVQKYADINQMVGNVNGSYISTSNGVALGSAVTPTKGSMSISQGLEYSAAYKSFTSGVANKFSFNEDVTNCIVPNPNDGSSNIKVPSSDSETWSMSFNMAGVGIVTAKMTSISYSSGDRSDDALNTWWRWAKDEHDKPYKSGKSYTSSNVTLGGLKDILNGNYSDDTPGLLSSTNGGSTSNAYGSFDFNFSLVGPDGKSVGAISLTQSVLPTDTEATVLNNVNSTLNSSNVFDLNPINNATETYGRLYGIDTGWGQNEVPIFQSVNGFFVQAGSERDQQIDVAYDSLSTYVLGIHDTNVKTVDDARNAISQIKAAHEMISAQRSEFGAYQNRFEHTISNLKNVVENTTSAESLIRDTDMAKEMISNSLNNILARAGESMMAQANQSNQDVLSLLS